MESSDIKRMKEREEENRRLKQMYASLSLDHEILKDVVAKTLTVPEKRELVRYVMTEYQASERRGCRIMGISRSLLHYCPNTARDIPVVEVLQNWHINIRHMALVLCSISYGSLDYRGM